MKDTVFTRVRGATFASVRVTIHCLNVGNIWPSKVNKITCD